MAMLVAMLKTMMMTMDDDDVDDDDDDDCFIGASTTCHLQNLNLISIIILIN